MSAEGGQEPPWLSGPRFAAVVAAVLLATNVPYLYRLAATPPGFRMLGSNFRNLGDIYTYIAWMKQAEQGHDLFVLLYDPAPQPRVLFLPLFLLLGRIARFTSLDLMLLLHAARVGASLLLLLAARRFCRMAPPIERGIAFALLCFATGLPGIFPEACPVSSMFDSPLAAVAWPAILFGGERWLSCLRGAAAMPALATGAMTALLLLVHPYDAVSLAAMMALTAAWAAWRGSVASAVRRLALAALPALPAAVIVAWSLLGNPSLRSWAETARTSVHWQLLSFAGLPLLALAGWRAGRRDPVRAPGTTLLLLWVASSLLLMFLPVPSQRRYVQGMMAPLALLAAQGHAALRAAGWRRPAGYLVAGSFAGSIVMLALDVLLPASAAEARGLRASLPPIPRYLPRIVVEDIAALEPLPPGLVMAPEGLDLFVPPFSGRQMFAGHLDQTPDYGRRVAIYREQLEGKLDGARLAALGVRYVLRDARAPGATVPGLREMRRSSRTVLLEVEPAVWERAARTNAAATPSS